MGISVSTTGGVRTLTVSPTLASEVGAHTVTFTVSDSYTSVPLTLTITVTNTAPYFTTPAFSTTFTAYLNQVSTYNLPLKQDDEGHSITITTSLASFITFSGNTLTFSPTAISLLSTSTSISVTLTDSVGAFTTYSMIVSVPNRPPYFTDGTTSFAPVTVAMNSVATVTIPSFADPDLTTPGLYLTQTTTPTVAATFMGTTSL